MTAIRASAAVTLSAALFTANLAAAQVTPPNVAALGGQMQAMAEACGGFTAAQLQAKREQQKTMAAQSGVSSSAFDNAFESAYKDTRAKLATMSKVAIAKACDPLNAAAGKN